MRVLLWTIGRKRRPCAAELGGHLAVQLGGRAIWADGVHVSGCASTPDVHWATDLGQSLPDAGNITAVDVGLKVAVALLLRRRGRRGQRQRGRRRRR